MIRDRNQRRLKNSLVLLIKGTKWWIVHSYIAQLLEINDYYGDSYLRKNALAKMFFKSLRIIYLYFNSYNHFS